MGKAEIIQDYGEGRYQVRLLGDTARADADLKDIETKLQVYRGQIKESGVKSLTDLQNEANEAKALLDAKSDELNGKIDEYNEAWQAYEEDGERIDEIKEELDEIEEDLEYYNRRLEYWSGLCSDATTAYEEGQEDYTAGEITAEELENLRDDMATKCGQASYYEAMIGSAGEQKDALNDELKTLQKQDYESVWKEVEKLSGELIELANDCSAKKNLVEYRELAIEELESRREEIEGEKDKAQPITDVWCADYSEDLTGEVGTVEVNGDPDEGVLIYPGWNGKAVYDRERDGFTRRNKLNTPAQVAYNFAMMPGWQRWQPSYRVGQIISIEQGKATVLLDEVQTFQGLNINETDGQQELRDVPFNYMFCGSAAFEEGDRVLVRFKDNDWTNPEVFGFESEPKDCDPFVCADTTVILGLCGAEALPFSPVTNFISDVAGWYGATTYSFQYQKDDDSPKRAFMCFKQVGCQKQYESFWEYYRPRAVIDLRSYNYTEMELKTVSITCGAGSYHIDEANERFTVVYLSFDYWGGDYIHVTRDIYDFDLNLLQRDENRLGGQYPEFWGVPTINYDNGVINISVASNPYLFDDGIVYPVPVGESGVLNIARSDGYYFDYDPVSRAGVSMGKNSAMESVSFDEDDLPTEWSLGAGRRTGCGTGFSGIAWPEIWVLAAYYDPAEGWIVWDLKESRNEANVEWTGFHYVGDVFVTSELRRGGQAVDSVSLLIEGFNLDAVIAQMSQKEGGWPDYLPAAYFDGGHITAYEFPLLTIDMLSESSGYYARGNDVEVRTFRQRYDSTGKFSAWCDGAALDIEAQPARIAAGLYLVTDQFSQ